jgi:hypothetical protein
MLRRRIVTYAVTAFMAAGLAVFVAPPANAYGGGCYDVPPQNGWVVSVCSSDDGIWMYPDYYINARGLGAGACAFSRGRVEDGNGLPYSDWRNSNCGPAHITLPSVYLRDKTTGLRTRVEIWVRSLSGATYRVFNAYGFFTYCC